MRRPGSRAAHGEGGDSQDGRASWLVTGPYVVSGVASIVLGLVYLGSSQFQPYHRDAIGTDWAALDAGSQALFRALLHVGGGGWLAGGVALVVLARHPVRRGETWARVLTPVMGLLLWVPTLWATVEVTLRTDAVAPWYGSVVVVALLLVGAAASATDRGPTSRASLSDDVWGRR